MSDEATKITRKMLDKAFGSKSTLSAELVGLPKYAYKDIEDFENSIGCKVNDSFRDGWEMSRITAADLRRLAGIEKAD